MGKFKLVQWVIVYYPSNSWPIGGTIEKYSKAQILHATQ